jgi:type IV pilus assembly protein PilQ
MIAIVLSLATLLAAPRKSPAKPAASEAPPLGSTLPAPRAPLGSGQGAPATNDSTMMEPTEFVDQEIRDVLRAIARAYNLNIFPYPDVKGKVTVTLHRMPVMDALKLIVQPLGYELSWENSAWVVRPQQIRAQGAIEMGRGNLTLTFRNKDLQDFAEEYARRTGLNILVDRNARGTITGTLRGVEPLDGLKAILTANGFEVRGQGDAWIVSAVDAQTQASSRNMGGMGRGNRVDLQVRRGLVTANLRQSLINDVVQTLADQSGYNMITYGQLGGTVDANLKDVPLLQALSLILQGTPFTYALQDSVLLIGDRNPGSASGQALSKNEIYFLKHTRVDKVLPLLPKNLPPQAMQAVPELNALLLSGTGEMNQKVKDFLRTIDLPVPQVVIEAVIVEFYKGRNSQYGVKAGQPKTDPNASVVGPAIALQGSSVLQPSRVLKTELGDLTTTVGLLPQNFFLQLEAIENSDKGRVLARPRLTTLNGQQANINVGTSDYFQVTTTDRNGVISSDYRAFNTGITLAITPYLTQSGQITAEIKPEVRTPRSTSGSDADASSRPPGTSTRSLQTNVSLKDGETIVLGGLMQTLDLENVQGVPLLSAIPIIGRLFTYHTRNRETTELAIFITPHVLRTNDSTPLDRSSVVKEMDRRVNGTKWNPFSGEDLLPATPEEAVRPRLPSRPASEPTEPTRSDAGPASAQPASEPSPTTVETVPKQVTVEPAPIR